MSRGPSSSLGDLAHALAHLRPADDTTREAIAAIVMARDTGAVVLSRSESAGPPSERPERPPLPRSFPPAPVPTSPPLDSRETTEEPVPVIITRLPRTPPVVPPWVLSTSPLPEPPPPGTAAPEPDSLLEPRRSRALLGAMLATHGEGQIDLESLVRIISSGRALRDLPRRSVPTLAHGVQLLLDRSDAMLPFHLDVTNLGRRLSQLVGEGLALLHFSACPTRGCGRGSRRQWKPYGPGQMPRPGTRVLCVTDLGLGAATSGNVPARWEEWRDFATLLRRAGCSVGALVPSPPERWPSELEQVMELFYWDRTLTVARAARGMSRRR
ncbi:hypothetical protein SAMN05443572_105211 [Myxococcus fulvus]|uniref:Uncharacterized protein n=1 Tax=Myxococcus fulvus TaxID=33 RepID=A0A511TB73_MYXFU|nr:hypothetical protein MFU01_64630 [Myxococcus fulvus]SEU13688.1 hypothetical protein SAMN05443572_105211 [Myxococcus fulvus]